MKIYKCCIVISLFVFYAFTFKDDGTYNSKLLGKKLSDTPFGEYIKQDIPDNTMIMLVSYGCSHCWDATNTATKLKKKKQIDNIIILGNGNETEKQEFKKNTSSDYLVFDYNFETLKQKLLILDHGFPPPPCGLLVKKNVLTNVFTKL